MLLPFDKFKFPLTSNSVTGLVEVNDEIDFVWFKALVAAASMLYMEQVSINNKIAFAIEIKGLIKNMPDFIIQRIADNWVKASDSCGAFKETGPVDNKKVLNFISELCYAEMAKRLVDSKWRIVHNSGKKFRIELFE